MTRGVKKIRRLQTIKEIKIQFDSLASNNLEHPAPLMFFCAPGQPFEVGEDTPQGALSDGKIKGDLNN